MARIGIIHRRSHHHICGGGNAYGDCEHSGFGRWDELLQHPLLPSGYARNAGNRGYHHYHGGYDDIHSAPESPLALSEAELFSEHQRYLDGVGRYMSGPFATATDFCEFTGIPVPADLSRLQSIL